MIPTRKVGAGAVAGAAVILVAWVLKSFTKTEITAEAAMSLQLLISFAVGYLVPDAAEPEPPKDAQ